MRTGCEMRANTSMIRLEPSSGTTYFPKSAIDSTWPVWGNMLTTPAFARR
jgi:hypothetical protein